MIRNDHYMFEAVHECNDQHILFTAICYFVYCQLVQWSGQEPQSLMNSGRDAVSPHPSSPHHLNDASVQSTMTLPELPSKDEFPLGIVLRLPWIFDDFQASIGAPGAFRSWTRRCSTCPAMSRKFAARLWPKAPKAPKPPWASRARWHRWHRCRAARAFLARWEKPGANAMGSAMVFWGHVFFNSRILWGLEELELNFVADVDGDWKLYDWQWFTAHFRLHIIAFFEYIGLLVESP